MKKSGKKSELLRGILITLAAVLSIFYTVSKIFQGERKKKVTLSPYDGWAQVFKGTKYEALIPYIIAQAKHETGNYTSNLYRTANNLFGMKIPYKRPFVRNGETTSGYSAYSDPTQSAKDLKLWFDYTRFPTQVLNTKQYAEKLKLRNYYEDTIDNYVSGLNRFIDLSL